MAFVAEEAVEGGSLLDEAWNFLRSNWGFIAKLILGGVGIYTISNVLLKSGGAISKGISATQPNITNSIAVIEDMMPTMVIMFIMMFMMNIMKGFGSLFAK